MAQNFVQVPPQSTGLKIDTTELVVNGQTVERQNVSIACQVSPNNVAHVDATAPDQGGPRYGVVTIPAADPFNVAPLAQIERLLFQVLMELQAINMSLASMVPSPVLSSELRNPSMPM
jgi:hypothetical protein